MAARLRPVASGVFLYGVGYAAYLASVQLLAMGLANRRLPGAAFGSFAVLYSVTMFFAALASRWLQHLCIRRYPGGSDPGPGYWRWFLSVWIRGGLGVAVTAGLSVWLLAERVGIGPALLPERAALGAFVLCLSHTLFEGLVGTVARVRRRYGGLTVAFTAYAVVAGVGAVLSQSPLQFMTAFAFAGTLVTLICVGVEFRAGTFSGAHEVEGWSASGGGLSSGLAWTVAAFAAMSLALRYLDRVLVGHFLGPESAGVFFALNAGVMATLLPFGTVGPLFHGWIAQWSVIPGGGSGARRWLLVFLAVPAALFIVSPLARLVVAWVYPGVALPPLGGIWYVFCLGRILLVSRDLSEPLVSRFGRVGVLPGVDALLLCAMGVSMAFADARLDLDLVYLLSGLCLGAAGIMGLVVLMATIRRRPTLA